MKEKYNVDYALSEIIKIKNNTYSRIIGACPNELFSKIFSDNEIKEINNKMLESQKFSNVFRNNYKINEKVLLNDNFRIENHTIKRRNKKNGNWVITAIILKAYSYNSYKIKIANDYKDILLKNEVYYTNITMIKKINDNVWKKINEENQKSYEAKLISKYGKYVKNSDDIGFFSSADNSDISESSFGLIEDEELIIDNIKKKRLNYINYSNLIYIFI